VAPNAGHALHMTSHIFVALGLWDDVIAANERAMRVVNQHRADQHQGAKNCGHYVTWLHYAFLQEHRFDDAKGQLDACRQTAAAEVSNPAPASLDPDNSSVGSYLEMRVVHALETGRWDAADALDVPTGFAAPRFTQAYGEALIAASGDPAALHAAAGRLRERQKDLLATIEKAKRTNPADRQRAEIAVWQIDALERLREGKKDDGIALLRKAAESENAMPLEFGPPAIEKPTFELLGDELAALGRHAEAEQAYRSALARAPGRTRSLQGLLRAQQALGKTEAAAATQAQLTKYVRAEAASR
jgi:tetratricopeptide (TPR) repeat protein